MIKNVRVNLVVARSRNGVIGVRNQLPWRLPKDLAYFKKITMGHPLLMGRKTFESIGRALPGRRNIVLTTQGAWSAPGVDVVSSIEAALELCFTAELVELMVIGGEQVYRQCLARADRLFVTEVDAEIDGDAFFPEISQEKWQAVQKEHHYADENNPFDYAFVTYEKLSGSSSGKMA